MLLKRTLTALLLLPLAAMVILLPPSGWFAAIIAALLAAASWEWTRLCALHTTWVRVTVVVVMLATFVALWLLRPIPGLWPLVLATGVLWWLVSLYWMRSYSFGAAPTRENGAIKLLAGAFVFIPPWVAAVSVHAAGDHGHWWTLLALAIVWAADTGAYFSGRFFGRRKLAPRISPGKTWAGVYGALVAGAAIAVLGGWALDVHGLRLVGVGVMGVLTVAASVIGDLFESLMKRHADIKDSGTLFPGHGGLLDRLDSVFAALPVFAACKLLLGL